MTAMVDKSATITAFGSAVTAICDGRVAVVTDGRACTDGQTIHLPRPSQIDNDLLAVLGVACHEAAHVYYDTPRYHRLFAETFRPKARPLAADCYNAVADVADETRFERRFRLAHSYFTHATTAAARAYVRVALRNGIPCGQHARFNTRDLLAAAILATRKERISARLPRMLVKRWARRPSILADCVEILRRAKARGGQGLPNRQARDWERLADLARQLFEAIRAANIPEPASKAGRGRARADACELTSEGGGGAMGAVHRSVIAAATGGKCGKYLSDDASSTGSVQTPSMVTEDITAALGQAKGCFRRYAKLLLNAPALITSSPSCSGPTLGDVTRFRIDGRVLLRRSVIDDTRTAVAVCLDCSTSVSGELPRLSAAAGAMAQALEEAGGNVACWWFGSESIRTTPMRMHLAPPLGGTETDDVVRAARAWLLAQPETKKVLAVFTDGQPADVDACAKEMRECRRYGIRVLVGAVASCDPAAIAGSMPGAVVFEVTDGLMGFHRAIRRVVR